MSLKRTYLLGGFVALALLGLALVDTGETVSEAAPLLGFTDTPVPVVPTPLPPAPTNTPPPPPPTSTPAPPANTPRPQEKRQTVPTPIPILPESGHPEKGLVSPWMVGGIALLLGYLVLWSGQRHREPSRPSSDPPSQS
jgi:hypothetical protein